MKSLDEQLDDLLVNYLHSFALLFTCSCTVAINSQIGIKNLHYCNLLGIDFGALIYLQTYINFPFFYKVLFHIADVDLFYQMILTCPLCPCVKHPRSDV